MPRATFERSLRALQDEILLMGSMVDTAIFRGVESLAQRNLALSRQVIADDEAINQKRFRIEDQSLLLIATQQPIASDLRLIAAVLNIVTELERMADHAAGIAKINIMMGDEPLIKPLIDIPRMCEQARSMLRRALDAFIANDAEAAMQVGQEDDLVDNLYNQIYNELLTYMMRDPKTITGATYLLWTAHNLERVADRVTNICERVIFVTTGQMQEIKTKADGILLEQTIPNPQARYEIYEGRKQKAEG